MLQDYTEVEIYADELLELLGDHARQMRDDCCTGIETLEDGYHEAASCWVADRSIVECAAALDVLREAGRLDDVYAMEMIRAVETVDDVIRKMTIDALTAALEDTDDV